jgi:hypothetical protein
MPCVGLRPSPLSCPRRRILQWLAEQVVRAGITELDGLRAGDLGDRGACELGIRTRRRALAQRHRSSS